MAAITIRAAIEAHRSALAASDPVDDLATPLHDVERAAWRDLVACPCLTPADVDAKLSYLLDDELMRNWIEDGVADPVALLQSLRLPVPPTMPGTSTSQHVNALLASYVATEAEQARLGDIGTQEAAGLADKANLLRALAEETRRRLPVKKAPPLARPMTPEVVASIRAAARANPNWSNRRIGRHCNVDGGRVSEVLAGFRT